MPELNVLGEPLQACGTDPMTGFYRDGCCRTGSQDLGSHTICAVVTAVNWLRAHHDGAAAYVVLASTHERALEVVSLEVLRGHAVDVPADPGQLSS